jgi:hypothetical protein
LKEKSAKNLAHEKKELEKTHMREIEQLSNTHRQNVFEMINSHHSEIYIVNEAHLGRLEDVARDHVAEKSVLRHSTNALQYAHAKDWTTFNTEKARDIQDLEKAAASKEDDFKQERAKVNTE